MEETNEQSIATPVVADIQPFPLGVLWILRILAIAGFGIAALLVYVPIATSIAAKKISVPFCSALSWFDCDLALGSEWATWFGVPVSVFGLLSYFILLIGLFHPKIRFPSKSRRPWATIYVLTTAMAGAALWFIYVQRQLLGSFCMYCMVEHTLSLAIFVVIWMQAVGPIRLPRASLYRSFAFGLLGAIVLIAGQHLDQHPMERPKSLIGSVDQDGYDEIDATTGARKMVLAEGMIRIDLGKHLLLGPAISSRRIVEVIDYGCPRCMHLNLLLKHTQQALGAGTAIVVVPTPLAVECNKYFAEQYEQTGDHFKNSCELTMLAQAVWLHDTAAFESYHYWLFEQQEAIRENVQLARDKAADLVGGAERLQEILDSKEPERLVERDVQLAHMMGAMQLPVVIANDRVLPGIPSDSQTLTEWIRELLEAKD